jgi:type I restriction enzyme M protein
LFKDNRPGYLDLAVAKESIKATIFGHPEFAAFIAGMNDHFGTWRAKASKILKGLKAGIHPKEVIALISEDLLAHYAGKTLIDPYDIYQHLMDYWAETMQDDCYLIAADGWKAEPYRVIEVKKGKDGKPGKEVDKGWSCDLVPKALFVARYFDAEQEMIAKLDVELESIQTQIDEVEEEQGGEEGAFSDLDKISRANVTARLKEIVVDKEAKEEVEVLKTWLNLNNQEVELRKALKQAQTVLDAKAYAHYPKITETEVKALVADDKWLMALGAAIHGEMDRVSQELTKRVRELAERYETPLPQMVERVAELKSKVDTHLEEMGFSWK